MSAQRCRCAIAMGLAQVSLLAAVLSRLRCICHASLLLSSLSTVFAHDVDLTASPATPSKRL